MIVKVIVDTERTGTKPSRLRCQPAWHHRQFGGHKSVANASAKRRHAHHCALWTDRRAAGLHRSDQSSVVGHRLVAQRFAHSGAIRGTWSDVHICGRGRRSAGNIGAIPSAVHHRFARRRHRSEDGGGTAKGKVLCRCRTRHERRLFGANGWWVSRKRGVYSILSWLWLYDARHQLAVIVSGDISQLTCRPARKLLRTTWRRCIWTVKTATPATWIGRCQWTLRTFFTTRFVEKYL